MHNQKNARLDKMRERLRRIAPDFVSILGKEKKDSRMDATMKTVHKKMSFK